MSILFKKQKSKQQLQAEADAARTAQASADADRLRGLLAQRPAYQSLLDTDAAKHLQSDAYGTGPLADFEAQRTQARDAAAQGKTHIGEQLHDELQNNSISEAGQQANAYSQLAMNGGLSSGARERIASQGAQNNMFAGQTAHLASDRAINNNEATLNQGLAGLSAKEAETRRGMQNAYLGLQGQDTTGRSAYDQAGYDKRADLESSLAKSNSEEAIARINRKPL